MRCVGDACGTDAAFATRAANSTPTKRAAPVCTALPFSFRTQRHQLEELPLGRYRRYFLETRQSARMQPRARQVQHRLFADAPAQRQ